MYAPNPCLGAVSEGFPSECLELVPDMGFRWLCGEPVPESVRALLSTSMVDDPVVNTVVPTGVYIPAGSSSTTTPTPTGNGNGNEGGAGTGAGAGAGLLANLTQGQKLLGGAGLLFLLMALR